MKSHAKIYESLYAHWKLKIPVSLLPSFFQRFSLLVWVCVHTKLCYQIYLLFTVFSFLLCFHWPILSFSLSTLSWCSFHFRIFLNVVFKYFLPLIQTYLSNLVNVAIIFFMNENRRRYAITNEMQLFEQLIKCSWQIQMQVFYQMVAKWLNFEQRETTYVISACP